jgi:broad specificity phosphatase PhoE
MDIFLVRHGEAAASWAQEPNPGLSQLGRQQAESAAGHLSKQVGDDTLILSSPLQRAVETAEPLATLLQQAVREEEAFREIPSPAPLSERQTWLRQFMQEQWSEQGDELAAWRTVALEHLQTLTQPAVVFSHFLLINAIVGQVLNRSETLCFWPDNGSITHFRHNGTGLELVALGQEVQTLVN